MGNPNDKTAPTREGAPQPADTDAAGAQLASGFGHEMRNALGAARYPLAALIPIDANMAGHTLEDQSVADLRDLQTLAARDTLAPSDTAQLRQLVEGLQERQAMQADLLRRLYSGLQRGMTITTEILEYAHAGYLVAGQEPLMLNGVVQRLAMELRERMEHEGITLDLQVEADLQVRVKEEHAFAILRNLLANACDALRDTPRSDRPRRIVLRGQSLPQRVQISVEDTGSGMSEATQDRVFRPFFTTKGTQGTGLGLGLSRRLAQLYGGDLYFNSLENQGTTFHVWWPDMSRSPKP